jgi:hypothetical protein
MSYHPPGADKHEGLLLLPHLYIISFLLCYPKKTEKEREFLKFARLKKLQNTQTPKEKSA